MRGQAMPCGFCRSALFLWCLGLILPPYPVFAEGVANNSGIIFEERTVTRGQAQRLTSVPLHSTKQTTQSSQKRASPDASLGAVREHTKSPTLVSPLPSSMREQIAIQDISKARTIQERPKTTENLLDSMDVYALSPHAEHLLLPRMIPQSAVQQWYASHSQQNTPSATSRLGLSKADWDAIIQHASAVSGLETALIAAVIGVESDFNAYAVSSKGAQGAMQIMPTTQKELGLDDAFNPHESVEAGSRYLRKQLDRFGSVELALAAYNAGAGNVERYGGIPPFKETQDYVRKVLCAYQRIVQKL